MRLVQLLLTVFALTFTASAAALTMIRGFHGGPEGQYDNRHQAQKPDEAWFAYLDSLNVEWVGLSISMFSNDLVDVTVHTRERPANDDDWMNGATFTDVQLTTLTKALHAHNKKVYWTLAFERPRWQEGDGDPRSTPNPLDCGLPTYNVPRYQWGAPKFSFIDNRCVVPSLWFWDVDHPTHAAKVGQFFTSMTDVAVRYAKLAQTLGVEMYSLGTETEQLWRTNANEPNLRGELQAMVNAVRKEYRGLLTYDQHVQATGFYNFSAVFADLGLDVVGISLYGELVPAPPNRIVSVSELKQGWFNLFKQVAFIKAANGGRMTIATEVGMVNSVNAPYLQNMGGGLPTVDDVNGNGIFDGDEQYSNVWLAFEQAVAETGDLMQGVFIWGQDVNATRGPPYGLVTFDFHGRPQANTVGQIFARWAAASGSLVSATVVEYYNAPLDHYFVTWVADEIAKLDAGTVIKGWARTSRSFKTFAPGQSVASPVCRFYIPPGLGDSHFFGRGNAECDGTARKNPSFVLESPNFMQTFLPTEGTCPPNTTQIYRVFSNRPDANHRYMTDKTIRDQMVAKGWLAEGDGPDLVVMCAPR